MPLNQFENLLKQHCNYVKSRWRKTQKKKLQRFSINFQVALPRIGMSVPYCEIVFQLFPLPSIFPNWLVQPSTARQFRRVHSERCFSRTLGSWPILCNGNLLKYDSNVDIRTLRIEMISTYVWLSYVPVRLAHQVLLEAPSTNRGSKFRTQKPVFHCFIVFSLSWPYCFPN